MNEKLFGIPYSTNFNCVPPSFFPFLRGTIGVRLYPVYVVKSRQVKYNGYWCKPCNSKHFQNDFNNWTSKGGFGTIHYARWIDGYIGEWDIKNQQWKRCVEGDDDDDDEDEDEGDDDNDENEEEDKDKAKDKVEDNGLEVALKSLIIL
ncbi:hypothetical protein Glove_217g116 [Diversispora epigaea]|uniref:Uncharacterized protein n=1 Tax=Diversispora epigaea TaxID=1348612 RepID=A0A397IJR8_9GLOM|nr:hypothetical protein Glove_217g116 [Diversispora epigaea]